MVPIKGAQRQAAFSLPGLEHLIRLTQAIVGYRLPAPTSLLLLEISGSDNLVRHTYDVSESSLRAVARVAQQNLRTNDLMFRHGPNELLILLLKADLLEAMSIGSRIQKAATEDRRSTVVQVKSAVVSTAEQDEPVLELIQQTIARARLQSAGDSGPEFPHGSIH